MPSSIAPSRSLRISIDPSSRPTPWSDGIFLIKKDQIEYFFEYLYIFKPTKIFLNKISKTS